MNKFCAFLGIALVAVLLIMNPGEEQFKDYFKERVENSMAEEVGDGPVAQVLRDIGSIFVSAVSELVFERSNYGVFSTFSFHLDEDEAEWRYLGIGGMFFVLNEPDNDD